MSAPSYEAYCPSCEVSHPPRTRRCIHCGGEVMAERPPHIGAMRHAEAAELPEFLEPNATPVEGDGDEAPRKAPGGIRVVISLLWIAFAIAISVYRGCQGG